MSTIVTRYAPSPTGGGVTIGNIRTAMFSLAYARANKGFSINRIEDSDKERSNKAALIDILSNLDWLGMKFDNAPKIEDVENDIYDKTLFQSQRSNIYNQYAEKLINEGKAYIDNAGATIFKMPKENVVVCDEVLGEVTFPPEIHKDFAIRRADGSALFHLTVCLDDALSGVTHVIRGNDHLSNTPKHIKLFEALGFPVPKFAHLSLVLDAQGAKISKRRNDQGAFITELRQQGFLPEAVISVVGSLGWSPKDSRETFDLQYLCDNFDIKECVKANPRYDVKKLKNVNTIMIQSLNQESLCTRLTEYANVYYSDFLLKLTNNGYSIKDIAELYCGRLKTLAEPFENAKFLFEDVQYHHEQTSKAIKTEKDKEVIPTLIQKLSEIIDWTEDKISEVIRVCAETHGITPGKATGITRVATTGNMVAPPLEAIMIRLGKNKTLERIGNFHESINANYAMVD